MADLHVLYEILYRLKMAESCLIEEILNYIYMNNYGINTEYLISIISNPCEDCISTFDLVLLEEFLIIMEYFGLA